MFSCLTLGLVYIFYTEWSVIYLRSFFLGERKKYFWTLCCQYLVRKLSSQFNPVPISSTHIGCCCNSYPTTVLLPLKKQITHDLHEQQPSLWTALNGGRVIFISDKVNHTRFVIAFASFHPANSTFLWPTTNFGSLITSFRYKNFTFPQHNNYTSGSTGSCQVPITFNLFRLTWSPWSLTFFKVDDFAKFYSLTE